MDLKELFNVACAFREAILDALCSGDLPEVNLQRFPCGCCTYASDLLQRYFHERGIDTLYMSGSYGYGWNSESHAWLETLDGTVIDITGDQYRYKNPKFIDPVYVGSRNNGFYDKFDLNEPLAYKESQDAKFKKRYDAVMRHMK